MRSLLMLAALAVLPGCQHESAAPRPATPPGPAVAQLRAEGDALLRAKKWEAAVVKYQAALNREASHVTVRAGLAVALSHLNRRRETIEQFRWILTHGRPGSPEVEMARSWLANAGELEAGGPIAATALNGTSAPEGSTGLLRGRTVWPGIDPRERLIPILLAVVGEDTSNRDFERTRRFRLGEGYEFRTLPPGKYRLTGRTIDPEVRLWDLTVSVEAGQETVFDLAPAHSLVSPGVFPPKGE